MRRLRWAGLSLVVGLALAACRGHLRPALPYRAHVDTEAGQFVFEFGERDRGAKEKVEAAIRAASPKLAQWGGLNQPVTVFLLPTHQALEAAVNRPGYDWLRAWARYDEIYLQSPRTWSVFGAPQRDVNELLLHELTHSVMYQQAADRTHWPRKGIPLWFREGMASWTAHQGFRWPALEDLARYYHRHPDRDPVGDPDPLYQRDSSMVYGAAHHAFAFLVKRYGTERVRDVLAAMREDRNFEEAFTATLHLTPRAFVEDFKRFVRLRGFRGSRPRPRPVAPPLNAPPDAPEPPGAPLERLRPGPTVPAADGGTALGEDAPDAGGQA